MIGGPRRIGRAVALAGPRFSFPGRQAALLLLAGASVAGCATFGTNVDGSFSCTAPDGICAPSSVIDDRALAMISGDQPATSPAGPPRRDDGVIGRGVANARTVARAEPKVLRIVFPARVDAQGRFYETSVVRAIVDDDAWAATTAAPKLSAAGDERLRAEPPRQSATPAQGARAAASTSFSPRALPSPETVAAARASARAGTMPDAPKAAAGTAPGAPVTREAIAADVGRILGGVPPRNRPTPFPGKVED